MKKLLPLFVILPLTIHASLYDDNSGTDRNNPGNWTFSTGTARDNILANGDNWLGQYAGHFAKAPYGQDNGTLGQTGYVGIYKTGNGDTISMDYTFSATDSISNQLWRAKGTVWRTDGLYTGRLDFSVNVRGEGFSSFDQTGWFGRTGDGADYDLGASTPAGYVADGPEIQFSTDLSSLNIQSGDSVVYRFTLNANDSLAGTESQRVGIGVQLVPEPGVVGLLGIGFVMVMLSRRRKA